MNKKCSLISLWYLSPLRNYNAWTDHTYTPNIMLQVGLEMVLFSKLEYSLCKQNTAMMCPFGCVTITYMQKSDHYNVNYFHHYYNHYSNDFVVIY